MKYKAHLKLGDGVIVVRTFENTVGAVTWTRLSAGLYECTLPESFGIDRIYLTNNVLDIDLEGKTQSLFSISGPNKMEIAAQNDQGDFSDWLNQFVEFEIFPTSYVS